MSETTGTALTEKLRSYFSVGPRTRRYRKSTDLHAEMIEAIEYAATTPGYFSETTEQVLRTGRGASLSYSKHVAGYRISGSKIAAINALTPWQFAAFLGQMVDAGVENAGEGERYLIGWAA